jgi:succinate dehydrogenase/fumarate reductase flavoprotein subunit
MNPLSIELYRRYKLDIAAEPLEFAVNNQHMNGGIAVDVWGQTSRPGVYAVGEAAGTHGVTRPGGAALNAGQVFGTRAAEQIAASRPRRCDGLPQALAQAVRSVHEVLRDDSPLTIRAIRDEVQARMSDAAGILCDAASVRAALAGARALTASIRSQGIAPGRAAEGVRAWQWRQMALASEAVLTALDHYIAAGGGSRGARAILDPAGSGLPISAHGPLEEVRFRTERDEDRRRQILVHPEAGGFRLTERPNRQMAGERPFFERDWPDWLTGSIYR